MGIEGFDEILEIFKNEVRERVKNVEDGLIALQSDPSNQDIVENLLREAHTIKGAARMVGYSRMGEVAHKLETLLRKFKEGEVDPQKAVKAAFKAVDYIKNAVEKGESDEQDIIKILENPDSIEEAEVSVEITKQFELEDVWKFIPVEYKEIEELSEKLEDLYMRAISLSAYKNAVKGEKDLKRLLQVFDRMMGEIEILRKNLHQLTLDISDLRLVPISRVFDSITRPIYEMATSMGKKVKVNLKATDIRIDKRIIDALMDAFIHLIRNALDHGIEPPEERVKKGKPEYGTLYLSAFERQGKVVLQIEDDGRGIDPEEVARKAVEKGVIPENAVSRMTKQEKTELIFIHGFSTRDKVDQISGRGVGMDVVKERVEELGGEVLVESTPGYGTRIELILPLTIATVNLIFFKIGPHTFAYPADHVENVLRIEKNRLVGLSNGRFFYDLGEERIPVVDLVTGTEETEYLIIVRGTRVGYRVNEVLGEESVVIKKLSGPLKNVDKLKGYISLSSETIAFLVDLKEMSPVKEYIEREETREAVVKKARKKILVIDDSRATREVVSGLLKGAGYDVVTAEDGLQALRILSRESFDLVVTDINMPGMDGYELTKTIRETPRLKSLPVIMLTTLGSEEERKRGEEVGADEYLVKGSFDPNRFLEIVRKYTEEK